ncbi:serine hydrolase [Gemmatimonas sp.]|uniref:serine hydrolase n=1 Tax=Gemmatimonas sp. TaxID=1962908 RepID=UPI00286BB68F|nr:serine hydrolase [Gemmatimonas sp.]
MRRLSIRFLMALVVILTVVGGTGCRLLGPHKPLSVRQQIWARVAKVPGAQVSISMRDFERGRAFDLYADTVYHAASMMKVPVLFALYDAFAKGRLRPEQSIRLTNQFRSIADSSTYVLDPADDSDSTVYARVGQDVSLRWLAERMITHSSNLATNTLITLLEPAKITSLARELGARNTVVLRGVEDTPAFRKGMNNVTTASDLVMLFVALQSRRVGDSTATADMLRILEQQAFNTQIPAGLPPGTRVAHKTGSITATRHDAGLVYPPGKAPYAIAILTRNIADPAVADALTADCSRILWEWLAK